MATVVPLRTPLERRLKLSTDLGTIRNALLDLARDLCDAGLEDFELRARMIDVALRQWAGQMRDLADHREGRS